jgi:hypothetical protein
LGGNDDLSNYQALCRECHGMKTLKEQVEYSQAKRRRLKLCLFCSDPITNAVHVQQLYHRDVRPPFSRSCQHLQKLITHKKWKQKKSQNKPLPIDGHFLVRNTQESCDVGAN